MLNLFKLLPFGAKKKVPGNNSPDQNLALGVMSNYFKQSKNNSGADYDEAAKIAEREMKALRKKMSEPGVDQYETMSKALRKMDKDLDKWT